MSTLINRVAAGLVLLASMLGLDVQAQVTHATSTYWDNKCASCHGGQSVASPSYPMWDSSRLSGLAGSGALGNTGSDPATVFKGYVHGFSGSLGASAEMNSTNFQDAGARQVGAYLTEYLFGQFSFSNPGNAGFAAANANPGSYSWTKDYNVTVGNVAVNQSTTVTITVLNNRSEAWSYSLGGLPTSDSALTHFFISSNTCAGTMPASTTCDIMVTFKPKSLNSANVNAPLTATLTFTGRGLARTINLSGLAQGPKFSIGSTSLSFGSTPLTGPSLPASTTITNTGNTNLSISLANSPTYIAGTDASDFVLSGSNTCTPGGRTLTPSASCILAFTFLPTQATSRSASASVNHNDGTISSPVTVTLAGAGTPTPYIESNAPPGGVAFPNTTLGSTGAASVVIRNSGAAPLHFAATNPFTFSGGNAGEFSRSGGTCSASTPLATLTSDPNASCTVLLAFTPGAAGTRSTSLVIASDANNASALSIGLHGSGLQPATPVFTRSGSPVTGLNFGTHTVGGIYAPQSVTLTNAGDLALAITSISSNRATFAVSHNCGVSLAAAASCTITVGYAPTSTNTGENGLLSLVSLASGSPHTLTLDGMGSTYQVPSLEWGPGTPASHAFPDTTTGQQSAAVPFTLRNAGPGGLTLGSTLTTGLQHAAFVVSDSLTTCTNGKLLYEGDTCTVAVIFNPGLAGLQQAQLEATALQAALPTPIALSGTGFGGPTALISLSPQGTLSFGSTRLGASSEPTLVEVVNTGSGPLLISGMQAAGPFTVSSKTCPAMPFTLAVGERCTVTVSFQPDATGSQAGALSVQSNAANLSSLPLAGQGAAAPAVSSGGGGCSMVGDAKPTDPTLWLMVAGAAGVLWRRRHLRRSPPSGKVPQDATGRH